MNKFKYALLLTTIFTTISSFGQVNIDRLLTENKTNPIGLDIENPRLTWVLSSNSRNTLQSAYEIKVSKSISDLKKSVNLVWSTGKVKSDKSVQIKYKGKKLESGETYFWQVRVWDNKSKASKWSTIAHWQMGLLNPAKEFIAKWIVPKSEEDTVNRPSPLFRKEFKIQANKKIAKATAYITAHGMYEAALNGKKIGDYYLTPGWTSYNKRLQYQVYDVTNYLNKESNAIGVTLGNGWYRDYLAWGGRRDHYGKDNALLFQLEILFEDGTKETVISDDSWKTSLGPILNSEIYDGELYDSTKEMTGWSKPGFNDINWDDVIEKDFSKNVLIATENEPIKKHESFKPIQKIITPQGDLVFDFGQNLVGWVQLNVSGKSDDKIEIYHAEILDKNGNFYTENLREADQKTTYILNGKPNQILEPHFTFQGFRYIKVKGPSGELDSDNFKAIALYSDMGSTGEFTTSNKMINQLQHNIQWGQKGNFLDVPTDCPQRDERLGWTGDAQAFFRTAAYNMNVNNFFSKWLQDVSADQFSNGSIPFVVPNVLGPGSGGSAGWGDVATIIPWETYLLYGDKNVLKDQYNSMKGWVEYIRSQSEDNLWKTGFHFGDWLFYSPEDDRDGKAAITDKYFITQCFYAYSTQLLINAANVLEKKEDIEFYTHLLSKIKSAFLNEFVTPSGRLVSGTQTAYVLALQFDMLPENLRDQAAERLVRNIKDYGNHLTTGFLGTPYINHVLSRFGHSDVAYQLLMQETYPSWLYPITKGATTVWERWDGIKPDGSLQTPTMNSYNHYAYGAIGDWMYRNIAGINAVAKNPGYKNILIKAIPGGGLKSAGGKLKTYYGTIESNWKFEGNKFFQNIVIPVNTEADVYIPTDSLENIKENNKPLSKAKGIIVIGYENGYIHLKLGSGSYNFSVIQKNKETLNNNEYSGKYNVGTRAFYTVEIEYNNGKMFLILNNQKYEFVESNNKNDVFIDKTNPNNKIEFKNDETGQVESFFLKFDGLEINGVKE